MKRLSLYLFLILFSFQTSSWADDISDFQIEGMSIGDSLLDYFSEKKIKKFYKADYYTNNEYTTIESLQLPSFEVYEYVAITYYTKDKNYKIQGIVGDIDFPDNIGDCYKEKDKVVEQISELFSNAKKQNRNFKHNYDKTGNSKVNQTSFYLDEGAVAVSCFDWSEEYNDKNYPDSLRVGITTSNLSAWYRNKAYK